MLQLENKRKLKRVIGGSLESWMGWEDPLVALVFGFAAYLPVDILLGPILEKADRIGNSQPFQLKVNDNDIEIDGVELWPNKCFYQKAFPSLLDLPSGEGGFPDAIWRFKTFNLIIEAKRIGEKFGLGQLHKYITAFTKGTSKPLCILAVGKGLKAIRSLSGLKVPKNATALYIDWESVLSIINKRKDSQIEETHITRCLKDLSTSLDNHNLKPFDGFFCHDKSLVLQSDKKIQETVRENWFPRSLWYILPETLSTIKMEFIQWLTRPLWVLDETNNIRFSPIPWLTK
jgi:hypothetical protein